MDIGKGKKIAYMQSLHMHIHICIPTVLSWRAIQNSSNSASLFEMIENFNSPIAYIALLFLADDFQQPPVVHRRPVYANAALPMPAPIPEEGTAIIL